MISKKKTLKDIDIRGKKLLVRVDFSVVIGDHGEIVDDYKIRASLPTLQYAIEQGASVVLISHMGRPEGKFTSALSLFPVAKHLRKLLGSEVDFIPDCTGERVAKAKAGLHPGAVIVLENLRFDPREESNDDAFAQELAEGMDVFVQDGFAVTYRRHASVEAVTHHLPSVAGLLLDREMQHLTSLQEENLQRPFIAVVSGLSIGERLPIIDTMIARADALVLGGLLADAFLHVLGVSTGRTPLNEEEVPLAQTILHRVHEERQKRPFQLYLPYDAVVASKTDASADTRIVDFSAHVIADIEAYPKRPVHAASQVRDNEIIVDIGPFTGAYIAGLMQYAGAVLLCGTPGDTAVTGARGPVGPFAHGTELIVEGMTGQFGRHPRTTIVTGDDAVGYVTARHIEDAFSLVSTGGGASMEVLAGHSLVGVDCLEDNNG